MKVGIICAGDREVAPFIPMVKAHRATEKAMLRFHEGHIEGVPVVVLFSGVCKVNAAIATQIMIDTYGCDAIINAGTAGGVSGELDVFDTVISEEAAYHDVDEGILTEFHPWLDTIFFKADKRLLSIAEEAARQLQTERRVAFGRMVTGEKFIEDDHRDAINARYAPLSVDMETASVAHVCHVNRKPFIAVRTLTDAADHRSSAAFEENCAKASQISAEFVQTMLRIGDWSGMDEI